MTDRNRALDEIAGQMSENILAVKGTLELIDASVPEEELRELILKAVERMDAIQRLSNDMLAALGNCLGRLEPGGR